MPPIGSRLTLTKPVNRYQDTQLPKSQPIQQPSSRGSQDSVTISNEALSEASEQAFLKANGGHGGLMPVHQGSRSKPINVTVHGINDSPKSMQAFHDAAKRRGETVHAFAYDDQRTRLGDTSDDLARELARLRAENPGRQLNIASHSMGSRIAVDSLRKMHESGNLGGGKIDHKMVNPMIGGSGVANTALLAPPGLDSLFGGAKPGKDMATASQFQKKLETTELPKSVKSTIYLGTEDGMMKPDSRHFKNVADGLNAGKSVSVKGADHCSAVSRVANGDF